MSAETSCDESDATYRSVDTDVEEAREIFFKASEKQLETQKSDGCFGWWTCDACLENPAATKRALQALQFARLNKHRWWLATRITDVHLTQ